MQFAAKLREADEIEEYPSYYNRYALIELPGLCSCFGFFLFRSVECLLLSSAVTLRRLRDGGEEKAWIYHRQNPDKSIPIEGGDWLAWLQTHPERHPKAAALHYVPNYL